MQNCRYRPHPIALLVLACFFLSVISGNARSEQFIDVYGGRAISSHADVSVSETTSSGTTSAEVSGELSSSGAFGVRLGGWFPTYDWLGLGMDLGFLRAQGSGLDAKIFPLSLFLAVRAPLLATYKVPSGRLQPYAMGGLTIALVDISAEVDGMGGSSMKGCLPIGYGGCGNKVLGPYLAGGLAWQPIRNMALFAEYRYTHFSVDFETTNSFIFPTVRGNVDASVSINHLLFGISYRFDKPGAGPPEESRETVRPDR